MSAAAEGGAAERRPRWADLRAALEAAGFRPSRRLGQNFLVDENMVRAIARDARVGPGDRVLEVGPGLGFLTLALAQAGASVTAVEIDERLLAFARTLLAGHSVRWIHADALAGKHELAPELVAALPASGPWHLVSNLPYSIAAPLVALATDLANPPASITVLVQKEVAERFVARPGTADWGPLSIRLQLDYRPEVVRAVPAGLFWPRPEVESAVVRMEARAPRSDDAERRALTALAARLFQRRRQAIARVLGEIAGDKARARAALEELGIDPRARAEDLDLATLRALAKRGLGAA